LSDPTRVVILYALAGGPKCVNELAAALSISQPNISRHLKVLRERSLVTTERNGQAVIYSLADERLIKALDLLRDVLKEILDREAKLLKQLKAA
jgi:ArsR family transcriptional regulator